MNYNYLEARVLILEHTVWQLMGVLAHHFPATKHHIEEILDQAVQTDEAAKEYFLVKDVASNIHDIPTK